jgi:hypothetical protein
MSSHEPPTLVNIPLELRQKIFLNTFDDEFIFKDIVIFIDVLGDFEENRGPKAPYIHKWASNLSAVHSQLAEEMEFVLQKVLGSFDRELERVLKLLNKNRQVKGRDRVRYNSTYQKYAECIFRYGIPQSYEDLEKKLHNIQVHSSCYGATDCYNSKFAPAIARNC